MLKEFERFTAAIARGTCQMFEERGAIHGRDLDDWLDAERQILGSQTAESSCSLMQLRSSVRAKK